MNVQPKTDYEKEIRKFVRQFGGFFNAHAHGDRAFTYKDEYYTHVSGLSVSEIEKLSLTEKQGLVWVLHTGPAFDKECLRTRLTKLLEDSIKFEVTRLDSAIDVTYNTGLKPFEIAEKIKQEYKEKIDFRIGAYNVAGFKDSAPERFEIFEEAVKRADFIVALAEKDKKPEHIGERQHNVYMLKLGIEYKKPVHFHVGQANLPEDRGAELLFGDMNFVYDINYRLNKYPQNMLVHNISASCYSEENFQKHREQLIKYNLGVICCPSAAISMRQERKFQAPIHNSIARVWDFTLKGIPVYLGTDNINDVFVPSSTSDLYDEALYLSNSLRFYNPRILAKIACGKKLDEFDKGRIRRVVEQDN